MIDLFKAGSRETGVRSMKKEVRLLSSKPTPGPSQEGISKRNFLLLPFPFLLLPFVFGLRTSDFGPRTSDFTTYLHKFTNFSC